MVIGLCLVPWALCSGRNLFTSCLVSIDLLKRAFLAINIHTLWGFLSSLIPIFILFFIFLIGEN